MDCYYSKMLPSVCYSFISGCRVRLCFVIVLFLLVVVDFDRCECSQSANRIFKREALDGNLQDYLTNFGYMPKSADGAFALRTEESIRNAIKELQQFAGIPVTGQLDQRTAKLMITPRCGLPDKEIGLTSGRRKRYTIHGNKWPYTNLTWSLRTKYFPDLETDKVRYVLSKALAVWSKHTKLTFTEVDSDRADILIYFYRKEHGDRFAFDGRGVILAHAFFPTGTRSSVEVHFDADENWTTSGDSEQGTNLFNVAAHEIGHSLGLSHSDVEGALMYPWYSDLKGGFDYELPDDDKLAIQVLYGSRDQKQWGRIPQYYPPPPRPPQPVTTTTTTTTTRPTTTRFYRRYPAEPRYPQDRYPYYKTEKTPYKPMNPEKKPHIHKPKDEYNPHGPNRLHPHHKHPFTDHHYPISNPPNTKPTKSIPRRHPHNPPHRSPENTTPYSPKEYPTDGPSPPDTCDTSYDAVAVIRRELFIFKDRYFWRIGDSGVVTGGYPAHITRMFHGFPKNLTRVDAVFERSDGHIVFFVGNKYYFFSGDRLIPGYPKPITELGLPSSLKKIDGAMTWGYNGQTYFFSGSDYWRFDDDEQKVEMDYPRKITRMWKGVGTPIDAVFQWKDGRTYFFKGKGFWKFNDHTMHADHFDQKLSAPIWMGCKQDFEKNDRNQKLPYTSLSGARKTTANSLWTSLVSVYCLTRVFL